MPVIYKPKGRAREYAPYAVNLYRGGCGFGCMYCYVPGIVKVSREQFNKGAIPREDIIKKIKQELGKFKGEKVDIFFSFTCDPYCQAEIEYRLMPQAIAAIKEAGCSVTILSKAGLRACSDIYLLDENDTLAASLTFSKEKDSKRIEPNAALPKHRIEMLKVAKERGLNTWVSLEPVIKPEQTLELIEMSHEYVDLFKIGKLNHVKNKIDWWDFLGKAMGQCVSLGKRFYIKDDLGEHRKGPLWFPGELSLLDVEAGEWKKGNK